MKELMEKIEPRFPWIMGSTLVWGLLAHGYNLTHKLSFHDDIQELFTPGATYLTGRWFLGVLAKLETILFGTTLVSLPLVNGLLGILLIGLSICVWAKLFGLENKVLLSLLSGIAISIPAITDLMGYMFMVQYYGLAVFMTSVGCYLICKWKSLPWKRPRLPVFWLIVGVSVTAKSIGIYQGMLPLACSLLVLYMLVCVRGEGLTWGAYWKMAITFLCSIGAASVIYMLCAKLFCFLTGTTMSEYGGLSGAGSVGIGTYLGRVGYAYLTFLLPERNAVYNLYPASIWWMHKLLLLTALISLVLVVRKDLEGEKGLAGQKDLAGQKNLAGQKDLAGQMDLAGQKDRGGKIRVVIQTLILAIVFPLALNLVFVMTDVIWIHALTLYSHIVLFILVCCNLESLMRAKSIGIGRVLRGAVVCLMGLMLLAFIRYSNLCYLKAEFLQAQATSYFDRLITRIQETEGYTDETPIVYLNAQDKQDATMYDMAGFKDVITVPFVYDTLINDYAWTNYMKMWNGFDPVTAPGDPNEENWPAEIQDMPHYPDAGSIKYIEDGHYMVVKF